jgi:hypothetical protein
VPFGPATMAREAMAGQTLAQMVEAKLRLREREDRGRGKLVSSDDEELEIKERGGERGGHNGSMIAGYRKSAQ